MKFSTVVDYAAPLGVVTIIVAVPFLVMLPVFLSSRPPAPLPSLAVTPCSVSLEQAEKAELMARVLVILERSASPADKIAAANEIDKYMREHKESK